MLDFRPIFYVLGLLLLILGSAMLAPTLLDLSLGSISWQGFALAAGVTVFAGGALVLTNRVGEVTLSIRQAFLLTAASWIGLSAFSALPFVFSELRLGYADAFFEAISGLTTTGSTVLVGLDEMPKGVLLWRALLQWIGGIGIIVMAVALLPFLSVGGMQLFRIESSDKSDKALPRIREIAGGIALVYLFLSGLCALLYWEAGMTGFEALAHAMTTVSTGGYSTSDGSLGHFDSSSIDWIGTIFMVSGALPFVLYIRMVRGEPLALWRNGQVRYLLGFLCLVALAMALWLSREQGMDYGHALRLVAFNVASMVTTTGFATTDYGQWGSAASISFLLLIFVGGCTGSTSGGIKMMRFQILFQVMRRQFWRLFQPSVVFPLTYEGRPLTEEVLGSVMVFFFLFLASVAAGTLALTLLGLDFATSLSGAATVLANVGPGIGEVIGPAGNFASLPDAAKWLLSFGMLLGRLELFTVLVILTPGFWRF